MNIEHTIAWKDARKELLASIDENNLNETEKQLKASLERYGKLLEEYEQQCEVIEQLKKRIDELEKASQ